MTPIAHDLHQSIGGLSYATSQTILAASRAAAHPAELDSYWVERALEQISEHQRVLDTMKAGLLALAAPVAEAA